MILLRRSILTLAGLGTALFLLRRFQLAGGISLGAQDAALVLGVGALCLVFGIPRFRGEFFVPLLGFWIACFGTAIFLSHSGLPALASEWAFLAGQIVLFALLMVTARWIASDLDILEEVILDCSLEGPRRPVRALDAATESIKIELKRSHRYERPLSLLVVEPEPRSVRVSLPKAMVQAQETLIRRYVLGKLGRTIGQIVRNTDIVLQQRDGRFIVLCPETDCDSANALARRIREAAENDLGLSVSCGDALLPGYQVTFEELLHQAEQQLKASAGHSDRS